MCVSGYSYLRFASLAGEPSAVLAAFKKFATDAELAIASAASTTACPAPASKPPLCARLYEADCPQHKLFFEVLQDLQAQGAHSFAIQATVFVLLSIKRDMHIAPSFAGHEFNIATDHLATQRLRETGSEVDIATHLAEAVTFNDFMRSKGFECQENDYDPKASTSMLHQRLAQCVGRMQRAGGWQVDADEGVRIRVTKQILTGGFFLSFTQRAADDADERWLSTLFSDSIA